LLTVAATWTFAVGLSVRPIEVGWPLANGQTESYFLQWTMHCQFRGGVTPFQIVHKLNLLYGGKTESNLQILF
jgi:hypothetical protein